MTDRCDGCRRSFGAVPAAPMLHDEIWLKVRQHVDGCWRAPLRAQLDHRCRFNGARGG